MKQILYRKILFCCLQFLIISIVSFQTAFAQESFLISGFVKDKQTQEPLPGVNISVSQGKFGTTTNVEGFYHLRLPSGQHEIVFSFISYQEKRHQLHLNSNVQLDVALPQAYITTEEVIIQGTPENVHTEKTIDNISLNSEEIAKMPFLLGEVDPVKAIQLLPGVQTSGDGNTGFHVRGGGIDQNLILLDDATIYNAGHLFGFFSVFNGTALDNVELIKGGIPAQYGGRLSSVMNISTKSGDKKSWKVQGGLGLIAGNLTVEGPIVKNKSSLLITGRRTYYDLINQALLEKTSLLNSPLNAYFHDLNFKTDYIFSDKDKVELSAYTGKDYFRYNGLSSFNNNMSWGNQAISFRWKHVYSPKLFSQSSFFYSGYRMDFEANVSSYRFHISSGVKDIGFKHIWIYTPSETHEISTGIQMIHYRFTPSNIEAYTGNTNLDIGNTVQLFNLEKAIFINDEFSLHQNWKLNAGIRLSMFHHIGPFERYISADEKIVTDTLHYTKNENITQYTHLDPRLSLTYLINRTSSLKMSYDQVHQYAHMAPMSSTSLPTDVWVPSSSQIKPQLGRQYALGYFSSITDNRYEGSVIAYFKDMRNQIEYRDGALISYDKGLNFDDNFLFGKGKSYGTELFVKKNKGHLNGWISYTLSKTLRQFKDLNDGKPFPAKYDRLHDLSVLVNYHRNPKWSFSGVWVLSSGNTMTLPIARYVINGNIINEYSGRNNFRMAPYHRMDVSATYYPFQKGKSKSSWIFSIYNVYSRLNPYFLYFDVDGDIKQYYLEVKAKQVSLFPIIPSVTYKFSF